MTRENFVATVVLTATAECGGPTGEDRAERLGSNGSIDNNTRRYSVTNNDGSAIHSLKTNSGEVGEKTIFEEVSITFGNEKRMASDGDWGEEPETYEGSRDSMNDDGGG